jgi:lysophospholipase
MAFENIPFHPLLWEERNVDVIIAIDSSADTNNWPNGTAMVATYQRSQQHGNDERAANPFPKIPSQNTFVNKGLNNKPTFFGCPSEYTPNVDMKENTPFVIYLPNSPYSYMSNFSTTAMSYSDNERDDIITNGLNVVTRGQGKVDNQWPQCLACGIILRALQRRGIEIPNQCGDCFKEYCWNGEVDDATPEGGYEPKMELSAASRVAGGRERSLWVILGIWTFIFSCG